MSLIEKLSGVVHDASDLRTLSGTTDGDQDLGTFSGATITDDVTIKAALQELETALEGAGGGVTNLGAGTVNATTYEITSSTGSNHTIVAATALLAGLMTAADFTKLGSITVSNITDTITTIDADDISDGHMGNFTTPVITDGSTIKEALEALGAATDGEFSDAAFQIQADLDNSKIIEFDASGILTGTTRTITMPDADVDLGRVNSNFSSNSANSSDIADIRTTTGTSDGDLHMGTFSGSIFGDNQPLKAVLQGAETLIASNADNIGDLVTLSGRPVTSTDLGSFTGTVLGSGPYNNKTALQALATAVDGTATPDAIDVSFDDTAAPGISSTNVQTAIQELDTEAARLADLASTTTAKGASLVGIEDSGTLITATTVEGAFAEITATQDALITLSGVAEDAVNLGAFSGSTIGATDTVKVALQKLETAVEAVDTNLGDDDLSLSGAREVTMAGNALTFNGTGDVIIADSGTFTAVKTNLTAATNQIVLDSDGANTGTVSMASLTGSRVWTFPDITGTVSVIAGTETLTNKTIGDSNTINAQDDAFTIDDATDATKQILFNAAGSTSTSTTLTSSQTGNRVLTLPDATDTLVGKATTDTLTNKTLTSPRIGTNILDTNGNELMYLTGVGSAVNQVTYANAATGNNPFFTATGDDANIGLEFNTAGTGKLVFNDPVTMTSTEDLADAAAIDLTKHSSHFSTAAAETSTLAAGTEGQIKVLAMLADTGDMVTTVTNPAWGGSGTITFANAGEACTLQYINSKWFAIGNNGAVFA